MGDGDAAGRDGKQPAQACWHSVTTSTVIAGIKRVVCETCGHVSVQYAERSVQGRPERDEGETGSTSRLLRQRSSVPRKCHNCGARATFITPEGLACPAHAWEAASEQEATGSGVWIPIRIGEAARGSSRAP